MTKRALLYGRVSQDVQRDNYSIPTQIALCLRHAQEQGYSVVGAQHVDQTTGRDCPAGPGAVPAYVDDHSGTELLRPSVLTMLEYLRTVGADAVIVLSIDRLARDPYIRQTLEREIEATGARVIYVQGNYAESPEGEIHKDLDGAFAKWENLKRVERCLRGKKAKAERGLFVSGAAPYGYRLDKNVPGGLIVCEEEAAIVRRIFADYVNGASIRELASDLTAEGILPARGMTWAKSTVSKILRHEIYIGRAYFNRQQTIITGDGITKPKRRKAIDRETSEVIAIAVAPLVDQAVFDQAQRRLDHNREAWRRQANRFYLLSGMIVCAECGRRYYAQTDTVRQHRSAEMRWYRHRQKEGHCRNHLVRAAILEAKVWEGVARVLLEPAQLAEGYEAALAEQAKIQAHRA